MMAWRLKGEDYFDAPEIPLSVLRAERHQEFPLHSHAFTELVLILQGEGTHLLDGEAFRLTAGDVFVVPRGRTHGYGPARELALVNVIFDAGRLGLPTADIRETPGYHALFDLEPQLRQRHHFRSRLQLAAEELRLADRLVRELEEELAARRPGVRYAAIAALMRLIVFLCRCCRGGVNPAARQLFRLADVVSLLEREYTRPLNVASLAEMAHLSRSRLHRVFREAYGLAPVEYLLKVRVERAAEWLRRSDLPIGEIASRCGFEDSNYFSRQFRRLIGVAPRDYRRSGENEG